jgi:hypothetical protein
MTKWIEELKVAFDKNGDNFNKMVTTLTDKQLNKSFDNGGPKGEPFTAWGEKYVYFPVCYDGAEWVGSAPRNPCDKATEHQGGG